MDRWISYPFLFPSAIPRNAAGESGGEEVKAKQILFPPFPSALLRGKQHILTPELISPLVFFDVMHARTATADPRRRITR